MIYAKKQRGIGLLELMLSLTLIAVLLVMATRFYTSTRNAQRITDAVQQITGLVSSSNSWAAGRGQGYNGLTLKALADAGLLPTQYCSSETCRSTWGGNITLKGDDNGAFATMEYPAGDAAQCKNLASKIESMNRPGSTVTDLCNNGSTIKFEFQ